MADGDPQFNRTKIRTGLAIITIVFVGTVVAALVVDDPTGRLAMGAVALFALVRMALLVRSLRRSDASA